MGLGELLVDLSRLLADPAKNAASIYAMLEANAGLAEFEVARFYVADAMTADVAERLKSVDPRERVAAVDLVRLVCPRTSAAKLLRSVIKDPDPTVRKRARATVRRMMITDVALKDPRFKPSPWARGPFAPGAYNPSGWSFGVYGRKQTGSADRGALGAKGLPLLEGADDVARLVGLADGKALRRFMRPGSASGSGYVEFDVPKATGGARRIAAPRAPLRRAQRVILDQILAKVPAHDAAHGFVRGRSTVTNAEPHVGRAIVMKLDLVDFFPSVHYRRVVGLFEQLGYPTEAASALAGLCTWRPKLGDGAVAWPGVLPQGAPTSPAITNLVCRRLDARLSALAKKMGGVYTRYADDLTFSFPAEPERIGRFLWWVDQIALQEGFVENTKKRRVLRRSAQQRVTGVVVNEHPAIPRKDRRRIKAVLANVKKNGLAAEARGNPDFEAWLHGWVAYATMVQPALGARFAAALAGVAP
ncbi:MAG: hypothetical protein JNL38_13620 [Myxococcales bacterium]|nr:hypothetical protein [Myxococcales bacterium]